jgi:hypothetical protein
MTINGKSKALALFSVVAIAAIVSGVILIPQMAKATETGDTSLNTQTTDTTTDTAATQEANVLEIPSWSSECYGFGMNRGMQFGRHGFGGFGPVEVSDEFKQTVVSIAENDTDVQNLMNEGYNATALRPMISTVIDADGNVVTKATSAVLILQKDTTGYATVTVNIDEAKVTQIVILTRTVIDKP